MVKVLIQQFYINQRELDGGNIKNRVEFLKGTLDVQSEKKIKERLFI